jgi:3-methylornithyl-N6-L-lysine dehydrogenase
MTRLSNSDINSIASRLADYDRVLLAKTGSTLKGIACIGAGLEEHAADSQMHGCKVCVVPMTCGQGIIEGFAETLCAIATHIGFEGFVAERPDVSGFAEAYKRNAGILLLSDDDHFVAINTKSLRVADNAEATGKGFVAGLSLMAGGLSNRSVLIIGCGPVGRSAAIASAQKGAAVTVFDRIVERCRTLLGHPSFTGVALRISDDLTVAMIGHDCIIDATPGTDLIHMAKLAPGAFIAAPGVPCGVSADSVEALSDRLLHDPLQIGVATMLMEALVKR